MAPRGNEEYPRNLERERRQDSPPAPPAPDRPPAPVRTTEGAAGETVRSEPGDGPGVRAGDGQGEPVIPRSESEEFRRRWESIQASFIDAPREAVDDADRLVEELTERIAQRFGAERGALDERWEEGDEVSTEDLRLSLQRYRGFFDRLLRL